MIAQDLCIPEMISSTLSVAQEFIEPMTLCFLYSIPMAYWNIGASVEVNVKEIDGWSNDFCHKVQANRGSHTNSRKFSLIETVISYSRYSIKSERSLDHCNLIQMERRSSYFLPRHVHLSLWNARLICNKLLVLCSQIYTNDTDIFVITETWLNNNG